MYFFVIYIFQYIIVQNSLGENEITDEGATCIVKSLLESVASGLTYLM